MKRFILIALFLIAVPSFLSAQVTPGTQLVWDQPNATLSEAQGYTYQYYPDGATTGTVLTGVTCSGTAPVVCSVPFPAFTPGAHSLTLTASNASGESPQSAPFNFTFVVVPSAPTGLRIQ